MKNIAFRIINMLFGTSLYAVGLVLTIKANIGYGPWEVFHAGIANQIGLGLGVSSVIVSAVLVVIVTLSGEKFGLGTIASMIVTGLLIDLIIWMDVIPTMQNLAFGIIMLISGLFVVSIGSYFYMRSAFGAGPRDNLMVVLNRKTKLPVGLCRGIVELTVTLVGWLLGGMVGIGTVIAGFAIGFCVQIIFNLFKFDAAGVKHETLRQTFDVAKQTLKNGRKS